MPEMRGITVQIPADLHGKVKAEQELLKQTMSQYIQMVLEEHFSPKQNEKGGTEMSGNNRTLAFQVSEELFQRVKAYLAKHSKLSQKDFIVGLIEQELDGFEAQKDDTPKDSNDTSGESGSDDGTSPNEDCAGNDSAE